MVRIRDVYKEMRETGWNRLETSLVFGTPVVFGLAPIAYMASKVDWANHPYQSAGAMALSTLFGVCTSLVGFAVGAGLATGLRVSRRLQELNPRTEEKTIQELKEESRKIYKEMMGLEGDGRGGPWQAYQRGEVSLENIATYLAQLIKREDHERAIFYADSLVDEFKKQGFHGLASSFRTTAANQRKAYAELLRQSGPSA